MSIGRWAVAAVTGVVIALVGGWLYNVAIHKPWDPVSDLILGVIVTTGVLFSMRGDRWRGGARG
jgi:hypothetical protein